MLARSLKMTLTAGLVITIMAMTALAPTRAQASLSEREIAALLGFLALGAVIHNSRDDNRRPTPAPTPTPPRPDRDWRDLPARCSITATPRRGQPVRMFDRQCLNNNYRHTNRLPRHCQISFRGAQGGQRHGYDTHCMRNAGFRTDRH